ncbi:MAG: hypothetical protein AB7N80_02430 [Bdellovibrionales bacterium]
MSNLALRVGAAPLAIQWLKPFTSSRRKLGPELSPQEVLQYAMALKQLGAPQLALSHFVALESDDLPEAWLYGAITLFTQARHHEAIPKLQKYLSFERLTHYQRLIGGLNLGAAYIFEKRFKEADQLLKVVSAEAEKMQLHLIHGNSLELRAQIHILGRDIQGAEHLLRQAEKFIHNSAPVYQLFLKKWTAVLELLRSDSSRQALQKMAQVRENAKALNHWETLRECDFYEAIYSANEELCLYVYFGSPYSAYRQRLIDFYPHKIRIPESYNWHGTPFPNPTPVDHLDLRGLKPKGTTHQILRLLCSDFYNPIRPINFFTLLYPKERIDPESALPRIFNTISRAKKWLKNEGYPLEISHDDEAYRLKWLAPFSILLPHSLEVEAPQVRILRELRQAFQKCEFTSTQAAATLKLPKRSLVRFLGQCVAAGDLKSHGQGRSQRYSLP